MHALFSRRTQPTDSQTQTLEMEKKVAAGERMRRQFEAIGRTFATINFKPDGTILEANELFLSLVGYTLSEIRGQHHRMFVDPHEASLPAYKHFWDSLRRGESQTSEYCRIDKQGREIWLSASHIPVFDDQGNVDHIVKFATDITQQKMNESDRQGKLAAIDRSQAIIEFELDGTIRTANENFLSAMGYRIQDIVGQHHRMFVDHAERESAEYREFWRALAAGQSKPGRYRRIAAGGREIWIQASYNTVYDSKGRPIRVIKYAADVTEQVAMERRVAEVRNAVANSTSEMVETINEISRNVSQTASLANSTEALTAETNRNVHQLMESSRAIEQVVEVIEELADQTNLLALNPKIQSARAGEAGRGFAVVADEVKGLANQTAIATKNIEKSVRDIQAQIKAFVNSTENITKSVAEVSVNMTTISSAVEEQSVTMDSLRVSTDQLRSGR